MVTKVKVSFVDNDITLSENIRSKSRSEEVDLLFRGWVAGRGVPSGGLAGQVLKKRTNQDYDTEWSDGGSQGGAVWGEITGSIANQLDLVEQLNAKANDTGDATKRFKCATATLGTEAANKTYVDGEIQTQIGNINALLSTI